MSVTRRLALLEWAKRAGAYIVEDDYDSEYCYEGRPLAALTDGGKLVINGGDPLREVRPRVLPA